VAYVVLFVTELMLCFWLKPGTWNPQPGSGQHFLGLKSRRDCVVWLCRLYYFTTKTSRNLEALLRGPDRGGPRSLVGILKCLVSAFCQGITSLSEIKRQTFIFVGIFVNEWQTVRHSCTLAQLRVIEHLTWADITFFDKLTLSITSQH